MRITAEGKMQYEDIFELTYELLNELELTLTPDGKIYDKTTNNILSFNGMIMKASTNPNEINYPGEGEIGFDIDSNVRIATTLFGNFLQRKIDSGMPFRSYSNEEKTDKDDNIMSNLTVKFDNDREISTDYYYNKCFKFIEMMFLLEDDHIDLHNLDKIIERK